MRHFESIWNADAEQALIGGCMLWRSRIAYASRKVKPAHLFAPAHQMMYAAILVLYEAGKEVNPLTLEKALKSVNRLEDCGGDRAPLDFAYFTSTIAGSWVVESACDLILDAWAKREIARIGADVRTDSVDTLLQRVENVREQVVEPSTARSGPIGAFVDGTRRKCGCPSGIRFIDDGTTTRGWPDGQMSVVAAYTGGGKSAMMLQSALAIARRGERVAWGTWADLTGEDVSERLIKSICGWSYRPDSPELAEGFDAAVEEVKSLSSNFEVYDATTLRSGADLDVFTHWLARGHEKRPFKAVFLDYAQKLKIQDPRGMSATERAEATSDAVRWLAARIRLPIVVGSQVTEGSARDERRDITKGSRGWEEDCGLLVKIKVLEPHEIEKIRLPHESYRSVQGLSRIEIGKNRFGPKGVHHLMRWDAEHVSFQDL